MKNYEISYFGLWNLIISGYVGGCKIMIYSLGKEFKDGGIIPYMRRIIFENKSSDSPNYKRHNSL
jgi:hypothetical protein